MNSVKVEGGGGTGNPHDFISPLSEALFKSRPRTIEDGGVNEVDGYSVFFEVGGQRHERGRRHPHAQCPKDLVGRIQ
jgi:hypothetical protein